MALCLQVAAGLAGLPAHGSLNRRAAGTVGPADCVQSPHALQAVSPIRFRRDRPPGAEDPRGVATAEAGVRQVSAPAPIRRLLGRLHEAERLITFLAFAVMVSVVFADVLVRELTGSGLHWARQVGVYANIFVVMIGLGIASGEGAHLRPRFADAWLPRRFERWMPHVQEGVMALFCLGFSVAAVFVVIETFQLGERSVILRVSVWPVQAVIPLAFAIATLRHGLYALWPALRPAPAQTPEALSATRVSGTTSSAEAPRPDRPSEARHSDGPGQER